jgi:hypothetical protein
VHFSRLVSIIKFISQQIKKKTNALSAFAPRDVAIEIIFGYNLINLAYIFQKGHIKSISHAK